jgi:2-haloacid dehalogenase
MTKPKAVVFDLGKVLVDFDYAVAAQRIAGRSAVTANEVQSLIDHSPLLFLFETGRLTREEFFDSVRAATGFAGTIAEFAESFADIFTPIESMVRSHTALRAEGIPTYIFSNTNVLAAEHIRSRFPFFRDFDGYILSFEEGAMKPDAAIYEIVEQRTKLSGSDILYLDDRSENIAVGAHRGWQVILQEDPGRSVEQMRRLGLPA